MSSYTCRKHLKSLLITCKHRVTLTKVHAIIFKISLSSQGSFTSPLIALYGRVNDITSARKMFDELPKRGIDSFNAMMIAYSRNGFPNNVLDIYSQMISERVKPDSSTYTIVLKACVSLMDLEMGKEVWRKAMNSGYENDVFVGSSVLNLYSKCGNIDEAVAVFDKMQIKDLVCWSSMINGFASNGKPCAAVDLYRRMQKERIKGDDVVMLGLIQACADLGDSKLGLSVHGYMIRRDIHMGVIIQTGLVDMYAKNGHLALASHVFHNMSPKNVVSWGALISGFAQNGLAEEALDLLVEMQSCSFKPDFASLVSAVMACAQIGFLKLGKSIHGYIIRRHDSDQILGTSLIDMYSKCGSLISARSLFDHMDCKDIISWNVIISGYGIHGHGNEALSLFLNMTKTGLKPDDATFAALLSALSHSGLVKEGRYWYNLMVSAYKIRPSEKHFGCMVDLLARAGQVEEALELVKTMDSEPGLAIWVALLSGCCNYRKLTVGELVAKKVLELNPDDLGIHALVSNFFALGEKWDDVADVRKTMKKTGMKKVPGYSAVEVSGELHAFLMEDKSHHRYDDILCILGKLDREMRHIRFMPMMELLLT